MKPSLLPVAPAGTPCTYRLRVGHDVSWLPGSVVDEMDCDGRLYLRVRSEDNELIWRIADSVRVGEAT